MIYEMEGGKLFERKPEEVQPGAQHKYIGFLQEAQAKETLEAFGYGAHVMAEGGKGGPVLLENREGYDFMRVRIPHTKLTAAQDTLQIYLNENSIFFLCEGKELLQRLRQILTGVKGARLAFERVLYVFFERLTVYDVAMFDELEQDISDVENALIESRKRNYVREIITLRKRLMPLKRHYERLLNLLDELQENENGLLGEDCLRDFRIFSGRVERHYHSVLNLRDYVTQVREAYQSEVDIDLNNIMKVFTVITAVFLPLTLIAGWYGMNLQMPELRWPYAYPMVICLCIVVVGASILYFKKKKWF